MSVSRDNIQTLAPMTPVQQGMLFHSLLHRASTAYVQQLRWMAAGALDPACLQAAWDHMVARHEILRTAFTHQGHVQPLQVVLAERPQPIALHDLSALDGVAQEERVERICRLAFETPFDLGRDPLSRLALIRRGRERWEMVWTHHHILMDGWSLGVLMEEWLAAYAALRAGRTPAGPAPLPFRTYAKWLGAQESAAPLSFWRERLSPLTEPTDLPTRPGAPADLVLTGTPVESIITLPAAVMARLNALAARAGVTPAALFQALWGLLLARFAGLERVALGTVLSGRSVPVEGVDRMVGPTITTLPLCLAPRPDQPVLDLARAVLAELAAMEGAQTLPLADILGLGPLGSRLLAVNLAFENYPLDSRLAATATAESCGFHITGARVAEHTSYPVTIQMVPLADGALRVRLALDPDRYEPGLGGHVLAALAAAVADLAARPDATAADLSLVDAGLAAHLDRLGDGGPALAPPGAAATLTGRFAAAVATAGQDQVAVEDADGRRLTYAALDRATDILAARLLAADIGGPGRVVGLVVARDVTLAIGLLAILKSGAAWLPLEPDAPETRARAMLETAGCRGAMVCGARPAWLDLSVVMADADPAPAPVADLPRPGPADPAYVIFTSGSTGEPKGSVIPHGAALTLADAITGRVWTPLPGPRRVALLASAVFDASVQQILPALLNGHTLVVVDGQTRRDGAVLNQFLVSRGIDVADATPSLLRLMQAADGFDAVRETLTDLLVGGEALPTDLARRTSGARLALTNVYGLTEATVDSTWHRVSGREPGETVPIGRPLPGQRLSLLDGAGAPVPPGAVGEIAIGGACVGLGYINDPARTAERFTDDPAAPGRRLFRTGDRARWLADGSLLYLGRSDGQVKIRGHRIELGEVEAALAACPGIAQAAAGQTLAGDLAGWLVVSADPAPTEEAVRTHLSGRLPPYMVPASLLRVERLPLSTSGKTDRRALAAGLVPAQPLAREGVPTVPGGEREALVLALWQEVLGRTDLGVSDNVFWLGADSIKAMQFVSRLRKAGLVAGVRDVFAHPTPAGLAAAATPLDQRASPAAAAAPAGLAPLTPVQERFFTLYGAPTRFNHALLLPLREAVPDAVLEAACTALARHHPALRTRFTATADGIRQQPGPVPDGLWHGVAYAADLEAEAALSTALQGGFDPATGRLFAARLIRTATGEKLLLAAHHLAVDAVSWRVLIDDLETAVRQARAGRAIVLPAPDTTPAAWATALAAPDAPWHAADAAHWEALPPAPALPVDADLRYGVSVITERFLEAGVAADLLGPANDAFGTTPQDLLLAALSRALEAVEGGGGASTRTVWLEGHGRLAPPGLALDPGRTVGWFTVIYPVPLPTYPDAGRQVAEVKEALRRVPHGGLGHGLWERRAGRSPAIPRLLFNWLGNLADGGSPAGCFGTPVPAPGDAVAADSLRPALVEVGGHAVGTLVSLWVRTAPDLAGFAGHLLETWVTETAAVTGHCRSLDGQRVTPSDLTYSDLSLDDLGSLLP